MTNSGKREGDIKRRSERIVGKDKRHPCQSRRSLPKNVEQKAMEEPWGEREADAGGKIRRGITVDFVYHLQFSGKEILITKVKTVYC